MFTVGDRSLFSWRSAQSYQLRFAVGLGLVILVTLLYAQCSREKLGIDESRNAYATQNLEFPVLSNPTREIINETEVIWQIPSDPKAVLFIAHGCGCSALYFWDSCPGCPNCIGLPEEKILALDALSRSFAVVVTTFSEDCQTYESDAPTRLRVKGILRWWLEKHDLVKSPLFGLGASSGGYFLSKLAREVRFRSIVLMIASGLDDQMDDIPDGYPPTLFVHMPKDIKEGRKIARHAEMLRSKGIETQEIKCMEFPLTPNWLADRISGINQTISSKLFKLFRDEGFIDAKGYMKEDGRVTPWREAVKQSDVHLPYGLKFMHHIDEELNLAYGFHEMTSLQSDQFLKWLNAHL